MAEAAPRRCTLAGPAVLSGRGLFTGQSATLRLHPAAAGEGVRFRRTDLDRTEVPASIRNVVPAPEGMPPRNTTLRQGDAAVMTVEHLLSALAGLGITDCLAELAGPEVPMFDGSAAPFVEAILGAGLVTMEPAAGPLVITHLVTVESGDATIIAQPRAGPGCLYRYHLEYAAGGPIPPQSAEVLIAPAEHQAYIRQIAPARTFCLEAEARAMAAAGLFTHLTPRDMLVIGDAGPIDNTLRFENEPARHKLLDLIGDLALIGRQIQGEIIATRAGHALNHAMARRLLDEFA